MAVEIETVGLNVHIHEGFDFDDFHLESKNLVEDFGPIAGLISMQNGPFAFENITMPNDLDEEAKIALEVLKAQLILNQKTWVLTTSCLSLWHFFVVNDGSKLYIIMPQTMHCVFCHFVCQSYNADNTTKRKKGMISYNQQHGTTSMKKHILGKHLAWRRWKNVNVAFDLEKLHKEKFKNRFVICYGAITDHFGNGNPYKKDDAQQIYGGPTIICCQSLHAYFCCRKSVVEALGHASKSSSCVSKL
jgi:hypothetical protein